MTLCLTSASFALRQRAVPFNVQFPLLLLQMPQSFGRLHCDGCIFCPLMATTRILTRRCLLSFADICLGQVGQTLGKRLVSEGRGEFLDLGTNLREFVQRAQLLLCRVIPATAMACP
jgi:hypothetical protein